MNDGNRPQTRMVHIRLPAELHKRLRIRAAENDSTLQDWVTMAIHNELEHQEKQRQEDSELKQRVDKCSIQQLYVMKEEDFAE